MPQDPRTGYYGHQRSHSDQQPQVRSDTSAASPSSRRRRALGEDGTGGTRVIDLLSKHDKSELPSALTQYVERMERERYDYSEHSRVGAKHGQQVSDDTCEQFCVLGTAEQHVAKLRRLERAGIDQWNIYLMTHDQERTLEIYGSEIIPALGAPTAPAPPASA